MVHRQNCGHSDLDGRHVFIENEKVSLSLQGRQLTIFDVSEKNLSVQEIIRILGNISITF